jgi:4-amino-4-deoxy-L-arabinose transferase-like glycosyltransferase
MNFRGELPSRSRQDIENCESASGALPDIIVQSTGQSAAATMGKFLFNEPRQRGLVVLLTVATFFLLLGSRALDEPDEGRYSEIAREMVASGNWVVPHLWFMPHLDKPPMTYWCEAISLKLFGLNEWAVRLPLALAALSGLWATFLLARSMIGARAGWISILLLQTTFLYFTMARFLTTDLYLMQFVAWALYFFWESWCEVRSPAPRGGRFFSWHLAGWVAVALAFMTKGPIALAIPVVSLLALAAFRRRELSAGRMFFTGIGLGLALMFALVLPWFLAVFHREPEAANYMIIGQAFGHMFGVTINNRRGSPVYFFGILAVGLMPWSILLGWLWRREHWRGLSEKSQEAWLLVNVWAIFTFTLFSLSHSKLPAYILPIFPALAILLTWRFFSETNDEANGLMKWRICLACACLLPAIVPVGFLIAFHDRLPAWVIGQVVIFAVLALTFFWLGRKWTWERHVTLTIVLAFAGCMAVAVDMPRFETTFRANQTLKPLGLALREQYQPGTAIVCWGKLPQGLPFYAGVLSADNRPYFGKMDWQQVPFEYPGNREDSQSYLLMNDRALVRLMQSHARVLIVAFGDSLSDFQLTHPTPDLHMLMESGQWKLFENRRIE